MVWLPRQDEYKGQVWRGWLMGAADFHGCTFTACDFRGTALSRANLRGEEFYGCDLRGADLEFADLGDATFDALTRWPEGFDPVAHGAWPSQDGGVQVWDAARGRVVRAYHPTAP